MQTQEWCEREKEGKRKKRTGKKWLGFFCFALLLCAGALWLAMGQKPQPTDAVLARLETNKTTGLTNEKPSTGAKEKGKLSAGAKETGRLSAGAGEKRRRAA